MEMILLRLPNKNVIGSKRTCRAFAAAYDTSKKVQRKLFMKNAPWPLPDSVEDDSSMGTSNPRHVTHLNPICFQDHRCVLPDTYIQGPKKESGLLELTLQTQWLDITRLAADSSCWNMLVARLNVPIAPGVSLSITYTKTCQRTLLFVMMLTLSCNNLGSHDLR